MILTTAKVDERRREYPGITVLPIAFAASELKASHWKFLMGAVGSQSMYIRQLALIMKKLRGDLTLDVLREGIEQSTLSDYLKDLALLRLKFAEEYIDDTCRLTDVLRPGRLVIVDLRDELMRKAKRSDSSVVLLQMFAETTWQGHRFNKLVVFDEAQQVHRSPDLVAGLSRWFERCATRERASWWPRRIRHPSRHRSSSCRRKSSCTSSTRRLG